MEQKSAVCAVQRGLTWKQPYTCAHVRVRCAQVWWAASDIGWVVGHSYIVYAPLAAQCTTVLYEGKPVGTPNASSFFRVLSQHRVNGAFYAPTALRAIRREVRPPLRPPRLCPELPGPSPKSCRRVLASPSPQFEEPHNTLLSTL